jgi:uncharacterized protein YndB with AHSA1/START domain
MAVIGEHGVVVNEVQVDARPETVFEFFTQPEKMERWMGVTAEMDARPGGGWRIDINGHGSVTAGEFVEMEPPHRVVFTWGFEESDNAPVRLRPGASTVEVTLTREGDGTRVRLEHRDLPPDLRVFHNLGWEHYLPRLALAAAGVDPGPDPMTSVTDLREMKELVDG